MPSFPRAVFSIATSGVRTHGPRPIEGQVIIRVLGGGGAYLEIDKTCPVGELVLLRLTLPGETEASPVKALSATPTTGKVRGWSSWVSIPRIASGSWVSSRATSAETCPRTAPEVFYRHTRSDGL